MMNTKEVARYLGIHEKHVYALIDPKRIPADEGNRQMGFPPETHQKMDRIERYVRAGTGRAKG